MPPPTKTTVMPHSYLGIDPGAGGGLAFLEVDGSVTAASMPETERDVFDWIRARVNLSFAVIEKVGGFVAGNPAPGSAMFRFGQSYGGLRMALIAAGVPFDEVQPATWQKALGIPPRKGKGKTEHKNVLKQRAQQLFPRVKVTLAVADAILLAEYCRRKREGTLATSAQSLRAS